MEEEEDPHTSIVKKCPQITTVEPSSSFGPGFELFSDDEDSPSSTLSEFPVDSTGIFMLTVPSSCEGDSHPFCSEEQSPPPATTDSHAGETTVLDDDGCTDTEVVVDLGTETDDDVTGTMVLKEAGTATEIMVDMEVESTQVIDFNTNDVDGGCSDFADPNAVGAGETMVVDDNGTDTKILVDMGSEPNNSGVLGAESSQVIDSGTEDDEDPMNLESKEANGPEVMEFTIDREDQMTDELPERETNVDEPLTMLATGKEGLAMKNINDIDKFKYVGSNGGCRKVTRNSAGGGMGFGVSDDSNKVLKDLSRILEKGLGASEARDKVINGYLEMLKTVAMKLDEGSEDEDDVFEIAKNRGMSFPTPRWWPPEGFD